MLAVFLYFQFIEGVFSGKVLLTIVFVFLTAPVAGFMIARSAYNVGVELSDKSVQDDLKKAINKKGKKARS